MTGYTDKAIESANHLNEQKAKVSRLASLRMLANGVTRGPWSSTGYQVYAPDNTTICNMSGWRNVEQTKINGKFIASIDPFTIIELVSALEDAKLALSTCEYFDDGGPWYDDCKVKAALQRIDLFDKGE